MALIVENGTGLSNAESFVSVAEADAFFALYDATKWNGNTTDKEQALRRATAYLSNAINWGGLRTHGRAQALAFPRAGLFDKESYAIPINEIPIELKVACYHLAGVEFSNPNALNPSIVLADRVKREKIDALEVEYSLSSVSADSYRTEVAIVSDLIAPFLNNKNSSSCLSGSSSRC